MLWTTRRRHPLINEYWRLEDASATLLLKWIQGKGESGSGLLNDDDVEVDRGWGGTPMGVGQPEFGAPGFGSPTEPTTYNDTAKPGAGSRWLNFTPTTKLASLTDDAHPHQLWVIGTRAHGNTLAVMQTRITSFFPVGPFDPPQRPRVTFMDLPQSIRRRIYQELDLISGGASVWKPITLNSACHFETRCLFERGESDKDQQPDRHRLQSLRPIREGHRDEPVDCSRCRCNNCTQEDCMGGYRAIGPGTQSLTSIFSVCRAWSEDAIAAFYSENHFKIYYQGNGGLSVLDSFRPSTIRALTRLTVRLSLSFCDDGPKCDDPDHHWQCHPSCKVSGHDTALQFHCKGDRKVLRDWARLCQRLATAIQPGRLVLTLIANTRNVGAATDLVEPMRALPQLCACSISLSKYHDPDIRRVAEETCLRTMGFPESRLRDPFPFRKLPDELQFEILRHAGLKSPSHLCPGNMQYSDPISSPRCIYNPGIVDSDGCVMCCTGKQQHSAANPTCSCWNLSIAPLDVDHKMRQMAQTIMYGENTWILDLARYSQLRDYAHSQALLKHVRTLHIHVSTKDAGVPYNEAGERWRRFITFLENSDLQLHNLTVILIMLHPSHDPQDATLVSSTIQEGREWMGHRIFAERAQSIFHFSKWRPKDVFVRILRRHHIWGDGPPEWIEATNSGSPLCSQRYFAAQEQEIERMIMDDNTYCAEARGKSKTIHEPLGDLPNREPGGDTTENPGDPVDLAPNINSWKPSAGCPCSQC